MTIATLTPILDKEKILLEYLLKAYIKNLNGTNDRNIIEPIAQNLLSKVDQNTMDENCDIKTNDSNEEQYINTIIFAKY
tara:strand:+ start:174 stop:410 length:237 start_codon:yes stop_codon:yes gene_type:complete